MRLFSIEAISSILGERSIDIAKDRPVFAPAIDKTGIAVVHETDGTAADLAVRAVTDVARQKSGIVDTLDAMIVVTQSSEMLLPSMAFEIQDRCRIHKGVMALDVNQGCSGFVQALQLAVSSLDWAESVLIVCADRYRAKLRPSDRSTNSVFSDAATATLISRRPSLQIVASAHHSDGSGRPLLFQSHKSDINEGRLHMAGSDVWLFTKRVVFNQIERLVNSCDLTLADIDAVYLHQASELVLKGLRAQIGDRTSVPSELKDVGNTVSSSIPILIENRINQLTEQISVLCGFGVGLSASSLLIRPSRLN